MASADETLRNKDPHARAAFTLSTITSNGLLPEDKANEFVSLAQNATPLLSQCRVVRMASHTLKLPKITFAGAIVRAGTADDAAMSSGNRAAPTPTETTLTTKLYSAVVPIGYEALEENVELEALQNTIMNEIAKRWGVDMESLALRSDTTISDATLVANGYALQDGWLKLITSNVVNASNAYVAQSILESARTAVALRFRQEGGYRFSLGEIAANKWREIISGRATAAGDRALLEEALPVCGGTPVQAVANLPVTSGTPDTAPALFCNPQNLLMGVRTSTRGAGQNGISVKLFDDPENNRVSIFLRTKVAFAVMHEAAAAKITNLRATA